MNFLQIVLVKLQFFKSDYPEIGMWTPFVLHPCLLPVSGL
ncbi:4561_t:CDS:2 [Cetraspora pellucida]|uniref:4561_t:CDS:1 n=1 Tax=Cetraspora pellucida TaxID=1433469 RepID=A0A9N9G8E5_9GLOM|nr:4561_t:CDS:2 [Cetraspora pellucida]